MEPVKLAYELHIPKDENPELCPVITMHGMFMNKLMLREMSKKVADATGRKVYGVDLRNHGDSPYPSESNCYLMAQDLLLFLQDHNIPKASFIGHSFSTRIATIFAIDQPQMVEKLIFMDFFPYADLDRKYQDFSNAITDVLRTVADTTDLSRGIEEVKKDLRKKLSENNQTGWVYKFLELMMTECIIDEQGLRLKYDREATLKFFLEGRYRIPPYGIFEGPVLLVMGELSPFCKDIRSKPSGLTKYFPKGECVVISDCTHLLPVEKPDECAEAIKNYLEK